MSETKSNRASLSLLGDPDFEQLRRAVLTQVREIKALKKELEEEQAKNSSLETRVALLEEQLRKAGLSPCVSPRIGKETGSKPVPLARPDAFSAPVAPPRGDSSPRATVGSPRTGSDRFASTSTKNRRRSINAESGETAGSPRAKVGSPRLGVVSTNNRGSVGGDAKSRNASGKMPRSLGKSSKPGGALARTGLGKNALSASSAIDDEYLFKAPAGGAAAGCTNNILDFSSAALILRLLERGDISQLGRTCRTWWKFGKDYLRVWRRTRLVLELGDTERTYIQNMRGVVEAYIYPRTVGSKVLDEEEAFLLFANTEEIYAANCELYRKMREVLVKWENDSCIGGVFDALKAAPELYRVYSGNQTDALAFAEQLRFELRIHDNDWRLLESFLIQPIQRIPRYQMLLREIAQNTPEGHADHAEIKRALELLGRVGTEMEKGMEEQSIAKFGHEMLGVITGAPSWVSGPQMRCLRYAEVKRIINEGKKTQRSVESFMMLFTNCVIICDIQKSTVKTRQTPSAQDVGASVAVPLGKGSDALSKRWKFLVNFSINIIRVSLTSGSTLKLSTSDSDGVTVELTSSEEAKKWLLLILP